MDEMSTREMLDFLSKHSTPNVFDGAFISSPPRWGKSFVLGLWESEQRHKKVSEILEGPKGHSASPVVWGVDMASGESRTATMTIGPKTFSVRDVVFTGKPRFSEALEQQEENVNYLFKVYVIDLKKQVLLGEISVICNDVPRATAIATLRLDLEEDKLAGIKFHVHKICEVPAWEG